MEVTKLKNISVPENIEEYGEDETKLPGFRFHPTDEELVGFYLKRKVEKKPLIIDLIKQFDIYKYDPWDLPISTVGDREWYFFCLRGRKYRNSIRPNRVTGSGFWKATGIDKPIYSSLKESSLHHHHHHHHYYHQNDQRSIIGLKKSLVYYRGSAGKGTKTDWMMHEFRLPSNTSSNTNTTNTTTTTIPNADLQAEVWTLCRIFKRIPSHKKYTPADLKEATTRKCQSDHSSFKTSSYESNYSMKLDSSVSVMKQYKQRKPAIFEQFDETNNNNCFVGQFRPAMTMSQFPASYSSLLNPINEHHDESWDELRSVVQLAFDPPQTIL